MSNKLGMQSKIWILADNAWCAGTKISTIFSTLLIKGSKWDGSEIDNMSKIEIKYAK